MKTIINVTFMKTVKGVKLTLVDGLPGPWAVLSPRNLRDLATVLNQIASASEGGKLSGGTMDYEIFSFMDGGLGNEFKNMQKM